MTGYARITVKGAWHLFSTWPANNFYLKAACNRSDISMLPRHGAKLKKLAELPPDARLCHDCVTRSQGRS